MRKIILKFLVFSLFPVLFNKSFACSCGGPDIARMNAAAELVFVGDLNSKSFFSKKYKLNLKKAYKGMQSDTVEVNTESSGAACGVEFKKDIHYIVFASRHEGKLWVDKCSTWPITQDWKKYTDNFNKFYELDAEHKIQVEKSVNVHETSHKAD